ncbi:MAG: DNA polymerase II large subunit [Promethearchaeota archaeon]|nr:MAG: DNA polymerase II large subunit [Candidatus Lokiarchaeota archaeon]
MVEMSDEMKRYFDSIQNKVDECYDIAGEARDKGLDPELYVECPQARDLAGRVEKLVGPEGVAERIRKLKIEGLSEDQIVFKVVSDILEKRIGNIKDLERRVERAIRVGLAIKTMGVVSAPLEGISKIKIRKNQEGHNYLSIYFAGPIRAAGGTTAGLCVLIADFVRERSGIPKYIATEDEINRFVEEVQLYSRVVNLQYPAKDEEIKFAVEHLPVEINGDSTRDEEVSAYRNLPRIETNKLRGGACLVLNDGILLKSPKLLKIADNMDLEGWNWLAKIKKIAQKGVDEQKKIKEEQDEKEDTKKVAPSSKYIADIIAGRPVFSYPSRIGGHRIRYGRSRNTGLAAGGFHPATMALMDSFVAIGTQLRTERPGKSTSICPVSSIEPPIVKLKNENVIRVNSVEKAKSIFPKIERILFIGDILFGFGEFAENNQKLIPSGYVEEWWAVELEEKLDGGKNVAEKVNRIIKDPFNVIPTAEEALKISKKYDIPLHPKYTDFWANLSIDELKILRNAFQKGYQKDNSKIVLEHNLKVKKILEKAFIIHSIKNDRIIFSRAMNTIYIAIFNLTEFEPKQFKENGTFKDFFSELSEIKIKNKAPYYMGTRMGRPEKSQRKSMKGVHTLFPLSTKVGNTRLVENAIKLGKVKIDICRRKCPKCGKVTIFNMCSNCKIHTELQKICTHCNKLFPVNTDQCPNCQGRLVYSDEALFNIKKHTTNILNTLKFSLPDKMKGIFGLTNRFSIPEPIEKGVLRARNGVLVYKTAEIRYDATDIPLTHFKPKEVGITIEKLKDLGYQNDINGDPIHHETQIIELKVQDVILSEDCANYLIKVANFLDDELELFYKLKRYYNINKKEDLIGQLIVGLAPHTSAGIIGRVIGFSPARSIYAHPYWHAAKRRNADGDEDGIMLLLDPLLNFSRHYLPDKIGGRMDATLVISSVLDPNEIDTEAHNVDIMEKYPLEFYRSTERYASPKELGNVMTLVESRLGTIEQYEKINYNIPTDDINQGPTTTAYKTYASMDEKIHAQLYLGKIIDAVDEKDVARKIIASHFNPDILGNLRKFGQQEFRCVKCNTKFRRPPISNGGKCPKCGNNVILTVNKGGIEKYIPRALKLCKDFELDSYTVQRMELIKQYVSSLTNNPRVKQQKLSDFF